MNAPKPRRKLTPERLEHTITKLYLRDGSPHTADELAAHLNLSIALVRRVLQECGGSPEGCTAKHLTAGGRTVSVYAPTIEHLRALVGAGRIWTYQASTRSSRRYGDGRGVAGGFLARTSLSYDRYSRASIDAVAAAAQAALAQRSNS